jgi:hypothetical protein
MTIEFDLARAMTAQTKWSDPKQIKGGVAELTADDIRTAVSLSLVDHPFAFHALMGKYCQDDYSHKVLTANLDEFGLLVFHETYPNESIKATKHSPLVEFAIKVFYEPGVYVALAEREIDEMGARQIGVHGDTWCKKYKPHFRRLAASLYELEATARTDYAKMMGSC